jgi:hypothetical protein
MIGDVNDSLFEQSFMKLSQYYPNTGFIIKCFECKDTHPSNFMPKSFIPFLELIRHPKTKLFVTHGGIKNIMEGLHAGVPCLCFPD